MVNAAPHTKPLSTIYWNKRLCASLVPVQYLERSFFMSTTLNNQALVSYYYNGEQSGGSAASNMISTTLLDQYSISAVKTALTPSFRPGQRVALRHLGGQQRAGPALQRHRRRQPGRRRRPCLSQQLHESLPRRRPDQHHPHRERQLPYHNDVGPSGERQTLLLV